MDPEVRPVDVQACQESVAEPDSHIRRDSGRSLGEVVDQHQLHMLVVRQPLQRERQALHQRIDRIGNAGQVVAQSLQEPHAGPVGCGLDESVGSGEVVVNGLTRDAQRSRHVGYPHVAAALFDRSAGGIEDAFDRFFVGRGLSTAPAMGAHG